MLKVYEICPGLYQRGVFINYPIETKLQLIGRYNIHIIVNLWHTTDTELVPHVWKYVHRYFPDSEASFDWNTKQWFLRMATSLARLMDKQYNVLVHCYGGNNRSGLLSALIMRELFEMTGEEAMQWIQGIKPRALHNKLYQQFLRDLK
jgi:protein-tyrosine phosphatase